MLWQQVIILATSIYNNKTYISLLKITQVYKMIPFYFFCTVLNDPNVFDMQDGEKYTGHNGKIPSFSLLFFYKIKMKI